MVYFSRERNYPLPDQELVEHANKTLARFAADSTPFFMGVGFYKPHLPFVFPQCYLDLYPEEDIYLPENPWVPNDFPEKAWSAYGEFRDYEDITAPGTMLLSL